MSFKNYLGGSSNSINEGKLFWRIGSFDLKDAESSRESRDKALPIEAGKLLKGFGFKEVDAAIIGKSKPVAFSLFESDEDQDADPSEYFIVVSEWSVKFFEGTTQYTGFGAYDVLSALKRAKRFR